MDFKFSKPRKHFNQRIQRKVLKSNRPYIDPNIQLEHTISNVSNRAYQYGNRLYNITQSRKAEGKEILKQSIKHGIGETTRAFLGPSKHKPKPKLKQKSTNNSLFQIFRRKK